MSGILLPGEAVAQSSYGTSTCFAYALLFSLSKKLLFCCISFCGHLVCWVGSLISCLVIRLVKWLIDWSQFGHLMQLFFCLFAGLFGQLVY